MTQETLQEKKLTRDELRGLIFSSENARCKRKTVNFNGTKIDLQQPTLTEIVKLHEQAESKARVAIILINHAFVPDTNEHIFEDADYDTLASLPFTPEILEIQEAMNTFIVGDTKEAEKN